jgi:iron complex outermembrane receptor protein
VKKVLILKLAIVLLYGYSHAQNSIRGQVKNSETGEAVAFANLKLVETNRVSVSDQNGLFVFENVNNGNYQITISYVGFETQTLNVQVPSKLLTINLVPGVILNDEVVITATRAGENTPVTFLNIEKVELEERNLGQDIPYMLANTPSLVTTSDAGTGIGYTGMRIRGSDATRINVTINGIPLNDAESQAVFWVNLPDLTSSLESVQIQRGVGTSTNGAGAFGASVNLETNTGSQEAFVQFNNSAGSFGTLKNTLILNTGQIKDHWSFEGRLSRIESDGYIDRARADLKSFFLSGQYSGKKTVIKALAFGGAEETYQSWNGVTEDILETDRTFNSAGLYFDENGDPRFYDQEVDDYRQDHYQLHLSHQFNKNWNAHVGLHYTYGRGFFEQYRQDDPFSTYGLNDLVIGGETIDSGDFIRRLWLDNDYYGAVYSVNYENSKSFLTIGGGIHQYDGDHFGEIIWAEYGLNLMIRDRYYESVGNKTDFNTFVKYGTEITDRINVFADAQIRTVNYSTAGIHTDLRPIDVEKNYVFFNPKFGLNYKLSDRSEIYASYAIANREPDRNDFVESTGSLPKHEQLRNLEVGYNRDHDKLSWSLNYYLMNYKNQLVLTGELNDVGGAIRTNVPESFRTGVEFQTRYRIMPKMSWEFNITLSQNRIRNFVEFLDEFDENFNWIGRETIDHGDTEIAFSPQIISASNLRYQPFEGFNISLLSQYIGEQFLNNASDENSKLDAYFINDLKISYDLKTEKLKLVRFNLLINNLLDHEYESNGWNYSYVSQGQRGNINGFYPQAGVNFLAGVNLTF